MKFLLTMAMITNKHIIILNLNINKKMRTLILEGVVVAQTPIIHNGGEGNGNTRLVRRQGVIQPNGESIDVPVVSGNGIRGKLRDVSAEYTLKLLGEEDKPHAVSLPVFQLLFSGGALTQGNTDGDIDKYREMRNNLQHLSIFGGAWGNSIMQSKMKVNPFIPICLETACIIPEKYHLEVMPSVYSLTESNMNTTKEDSKNPNYQEYIERKDDDQFASRQMIYYTEQIKMGVSFYWKVVLESVSNAEFDFFVALLQEFKKNPTVGGNGRVGNGQISIKADDWVDISKSGGDVSVEEHTTQTLYEKVVKENKNGIKAFLKML